jgi:hypothetical protein
MIFLETARWKSTKMLFSDSEVILVQGVRIIALFLFLFILDPKVEITTGLIQFVLVFCLFVIQVIMALIMKMNIKE